jgi:hypothetical protein
LNNRSTSIQIFLIVSILLQVIFCANEWVTLIKTHALNRIDFVSFYTAGRIARSGDYAHLYDLQAQNEIQKNIIPPGSFAGDVNLSQHPPYLAPLLTLIASDDYVKAYIYWSVVLLCMFMVCFFIIYKFLLSSGWNPLSAALCAANSVCFYPLLLSFLKGQDTAFILCGLLLWMFGLLKGKEFVSGFGLALATLSPPIAGALALPLISSRRKAGGWFCLAFIGLAAISLGLVGLKGGIDYLHLLFISSQGQGYALNQSEMFNFLGLLLRSFPTLNVDIVHILAWSATIVSLIATCWFCWGKRTLLRTEHIGLVVVMATFTSPHLHSHSLGYLLLPMLGLSNLLWKQTNNLAKIAAVIFIPITSLLMEASNLAGDAGLYVITYILMAALGGWCVYFIIKNSEVMPLSEGG